MDSNTGLTNALPLMAARGGSTSPDFLKESEGKQEMYQILIPELKST
jgi:hypothetical protein